MGLDLLTVQLLCCAKNMGVDFSEVATIGRQFVEKQPEFFSVLGAAGVAPDAIAQIENNSYGETLLSLLGAKDISAVDASDYEGADCIQDLNEPLDQKLQARFSLVFDGGSLEHIFNLPQALKNCMDMVRQGGHFVEITAANNFMGHGFWQLSPEAMYSVFCAENGFRVRAVLLVEMARHTNGAQRIMPWYLVGNPTAYGGRVELINRRRTFICTIAERVAVKPIFARWPQQSDYVEKWKGSSVPEQGSVNASIFSYLRRITPAPVKDAVRAGLKRFDGRFDRPYYRKISAEDFVHARLGQSSTI
jgi:hypothetical protein